MEQRLYATIAGFMEGLARSLAWAGGFVLVAMALTTVASVIGRALTGFGLGPIKGDFELVEMGCAVAVFAFLPWCQLKRGHVTVDLFIARFPSRIRALLGLVGDLLIAVAALVIFFQLARQFGEKLPYGGPGLRKALGIGMKPFFAETSYELAVPVWIPLGLGLIGAFAFLLISLFTVWRSIRWVAQGQEGAA